MDGIEGTYRHGQVQLDTAVAWPEGTRVEVAPVAGETRDRAEPDWGIDDDWPDTPANRAEILRRIDAVEPLEMTPEEEASAHAMLDWFGDYTREAVKRDMGLMP